METAIDRKGMIDEARAVRSYLEFLMPSKPSAEEPEKSDGRRRRTDSPETIEKRIAAVDAKIAGANTLAKLDLIQKRKELEAQLVMSRKAAATTKAADPAAIKAALEQGFIDHADSYGERKGITYAAWREMKVPPSILKAAGIARSG